MGIVKKESNRALPGLRSCSTVLLPVVRPCCTRKSKCHYQRTRELLPARAFVLAAGTLRMASLLKPLVRSVL